MIGYVRLAADGAREGVEVVAAPAPPGGDFVDLDRRARIGAGHDPALGLLDMRLVADVDPAVGAEDGEARDERASPASPRCRPSRRRRSGYGRSWCRPAGMSEARFSQMTRTFAAGAHQLRPRGR